MLVVNFEQLYYDTDFSFKRNFMNSVCLVYKLIYQIIPLLVIANCKIYLFFILNLFDKGFEFMEVLWLKQ